MSADKRTLRICKNGHRYYKSSDCPTCPTCENEKTPRDFFSLLSSPARRALESIGVKTLKQLSRYSETEILSLHGMGPSSIPKLRVAMKAEGLTFKKTDLPKTGLKK